MGTFQVSIICQVFIVIHNVFQCCCFFSDLMFFVFIYYFNLFFYFYPILLQLVMGLFFVSVVGAAGFSKRSQRQSRMSAQVSASAQTGVAKVSSGH